MAIACRKMLPQSSDYILLRDKTLQVQTPVDTQIHVLSSFDPIFRGLSLTTSDPYESLLLVVGFQLSFLLTDN